MASRDQNYNDYNTLRVSAPATCSETWTNTPQTYDKSEGNVKSSSYQSSLSTDGLAGLSSAVEAIKRTKLEMDMQALNAKIQSVPDIKVSGDFSASGCNVLTSNGSNTLPTFVGTIAAGSFLNGNANWVSPAPQITAGFGVQVQYDVNHDTNYVSLNVNDLEKWVDSRCQHQLFQLLKSYDIKPKYQGEQVKAGSTSDVKVELELVKVDARARFVFKDVTADNYERAMKVLEK